MKKQAAFVLSLLALLQGQSQGVEFVEIMTGGALDLTLSRDGKTVFNDRPDTQQLWSESDGFHTDVPLDVTYPSALAPDGSFVVGQFSEDGNRGVPAVWRKETGVKILPIPPQAQSGNASGASSDGSVIVGTVRDCEGGVCRPKQVRWEFDELALVSLGVPESIGKQNVSGDGSLIVHTSATPQGEAVFGWTAEKGSFELGVAGRNVLGVFASQTGDIVAGHFQGFPGEIGRSFVWTPEEGASDLGSPPVEGSNYNAVSGITGDGAVVFGHYGPTGWGEGGNRGFVWDAHFGMRDFEDILVNEYDVTDSERSRVAIVAGVSDDRKTVLTYRPMDEVFTFIGGPWRLAKLDWPIGPPTENGDMNFDGIVDATDVDLQTEAVRQYPKATFHDRDFSGQVNRDDLTHLIKNTLNTWFGDANLDGEFNSSDLVNIFAAGEYEDGIDGNSGWAEGDWNADGDFTTSDLTSAFQDGGYGQGTRVAVAAVPEPSAGLLLLLGLNAVALRVRTGRDGR